MVRHSEGLFLDGAFSVPYGGYYTAQGHGLEWVGWYKFVPFMDATGTNVLINNKDGSSIS